MNKKYIFLLFSLLFLNINAQNDSIYIKKILDKAYSLEQSKPDSALFLYDKILEFSKNNNYLLYVAKANNYKGIVFSDMGKYDSAFSCYNKSINVFKNINNQKGIASNLINIANIFQFKGDFENAINYYIKGIKIYEKLKDDYRLNISYSNLASIFDDIDQKNEAKRNWLKSIKLSKKLNDSIQLIYNQYNLADLYLDENKTDSAYMYIKQAKIYLNNKTNKYLKLLINYSETRYFIEKQDFETAFKTITKALNYAKQTNNPYYLSLSHNLLGFVYFKQKKYGRALTETHKGLDIAKKYQNKSNLIKINSQLSTIYNKMNRYKKALFYKNLQYKYKDSVLNERHKKNINLLNIKYQTEKKNKVIAEQNLKLQRQKMQYNYMMGIVVFLLITSILTWFLFRQLQKRKNQEIIRLKAEHQIKTLESLIKGEEKERFRIAKELHDGVNGDLSAIKYKLSSLLEMNNTVIKEAIAMIDNSCNQVRAISHNLLPPSLDEFNLLQATENFCNNMDEIHPVKINFQHIGESLKISKKIQINIYRIIQELVNNSIKHAEASQINVQMSCHNNLLQITVEDNGKGFDKDNVKNKGIGLSNIKSRVNFLQAIFDIISDDKGTSITIEIDTNKLNDY